MQNINDDTILIVDDNPTNLQLLLNTLQNAGFKVLIATDGKQALQRAQLGKPDLILLDVIMPDMDGYTTCQRLKSDAQLQDIPVIFMTALAETEDKLSGFAAGGVDYVTKPFSHEEVLARVRTHLTLRKLQAAMQEQNQRLQDTTTQLQAISEALSGFLRSGQLQQAALGILQAALACTQSQHGMIVSIKDGDDKQEPDSGIALIIEALHGVLVEGAANQALYDAIQRSLQQQERVTIDDKRGRKTPWLQTLLEQQQVLISNSDAVAANDFMLGDSQQRHILAVPLQQGPKLIGFIAVANRAQGYSEEQASALERLQQAAAVLLGYQRSQRREATAMRLQQQAEATVNYLREEIKGQYNFDQIICESQSFREVLKQVEQVACTDSTVLIHGETGTGKELIAQAVHNLSTRNNHLLIKVNCAALPSELVESELFGHEKGAFTGALAQRKGRFELADGGTLFLDEIGDMPLSAQSKLLRALQEREIERVGGHETIAVDVRVLAASHHDLLALVGEGRFREDLFYRLNVFPISLPPLRERREDIRPLVRFFAQRSAAKLGRNIKAIDEAATRRLLSYHWPGNVRELENLIERSVILSTKEVLQVSEAMFPQAVRQVMVSAEQAGDNSAQEVVTNTVTTTSNLEPSSPEPSNPEPSNPEPSNPEPSNPEPSNPEPSSPEPSSPEPSSPEPSSLEPSNPEPSSLEPSSPEPDNPESSSLEPSSPEPSSPEPSSPESESASKDDLPVAMTLEEMQRYYILQVLNRADWIIEGEEGAAAILGLKPSTLRNRMVKLDIQKPMEIADINDKHALN